VDGWSALCSTSTNLLKVSTSFSIVRLMAAVAGGSLPCVCWTWRTEPALLIYGSASYEFRVLICKRQRILEMNIHTHTHTHTRTSEAPHHGGTTLNIPVPPWAPHIKKTAPIVCAMFSWARHDPRHDLNVKLPRDVCSYHIPTSCNNSTLCKQQH
jgi:hypothetical protein